MSNETNPFANGEGDAWYERNHEAMEKYDIDTDPVAKLVDKVVVPGDRRFFIDIGCSSGERLNAFLEIYQAYGFGLDVSEKAIHRARHHKHGYYWIGDHLQEWPSDIIKCQKLIIMSFIWHWIPREDLLKAMDNVTSHTSPGDYLIIGDFRSMFLKRRKYHHLPNQDVWTWKAPYYHMLTITGLWKYVSGTTVEMKDHIRAYDLLQRIDPKEGYMEEDSNGHCNSNPALNP